MTGRTNYTGVSNGDAPNFGPDITDVYEHFDPLIGESVANVAALPASGNWVGRSIYVDADKSVRVLTALPNTWMAVTAPVYSIRTKNAAQSVATATWTTITFPLSEGESGITYSGGTFTVPTAGIYYVSAQVGFAAVGSPAGQRTIRLRTSSGLTRQSPQMIPNSTYTAIPVISTAVKLNAGDTLYVEAYQSQGSAQNAEGDIEKSFISIQRVGAS